MFQILILAAVIAGIPSLAQAEPIERSQIFVKDGDTIIKADGGGKWTRDQEYRLIAFDAPETGLRAKCA